MTYGLENLTTTRLSRHRKRIGRGSGSGQGTYAGRGLKGQRARSGGRRGIARRAIKQLIFHLPKSRGFRSLRAKARIIQISSLEQFAAGATVTPTELCRAGLCGPGEPVKILGNAKLTKKLIVRAHGFSAAARRAITQAGGQAQVIPARFSSTTAPTKT